MGHPHPLKMHRTALGLEVGHHGAATVVAAGLSPENTSTSRSSKLTAILLLMIEILHDLMYQSGRIIW